MPTYCTKMLEFQPILNMIQILNNKPASIRNLSHQRKSRNKDNNSDFS